MCKCCKDISFLKEIYDKRFRFYATITTKSRGGTVNHSKYILDYCPMCGKKLNSIT